MHLSQKIGIGVFLCLSVCMIMIAGIRLSRIYPGGTTINSWQFLWLEIEACIAVFMVSLTAFRSVFVGHERVEADKGRKWYSSAVARNLERRKFREGLRPCESQSTDTIPQLSKTRLFVKEDRLCAKGHLYDDEETDPGYHSVDKPWPLDPCVEGSLWANQGNHLSHHEK